MKIIREISVFFPAYNEEKNIKKTVLNAESILKKIADKYEILIIDDGSRDNTSGIIKPLAASNKSIRLIRHEVNKGYGAALISGFYNCKYELIAFMDSDGQFDFSEIVKFIDVQKKTNADLIIGYYIKRRVSLFRILNSKIWQFLVMILFGLKVKDIDCGFKLVKKKVIEKIPKLESQRGAFITTEFLVKAKSEKFKITEIPVSHYLRNEGEATGAKIEVIISSFRDLFKLRHKLKVESDGRI
jgi:glycosyltransferase involved in cell wall biosynthesis